MFCAAKFLKTKSRFLLSYSTLLIDHLLLLSVIICAYAAVLFKYTPLPAHLTIFGLYYYMVVTHAGVLHETPHENFLQNITHIDSNNAFSYCVVCISLFFLIAQHTPFRSGTFVFTYCLFFLFMCEFTVWFYNCFFLPDLFSTKSTSLYNGFFNIHPILFYTMLYFVLFLPAAAFFFLKNSNVFLKNFSALTYFLRKCLNYFILLSLFCLLLGSWWSFLEITWGGWWNWDMIEIISVIYLFGFTAIRHCKLTHFAVYCGKTAAILFCVVVEYSALLKMGAISSVHNFVELGSLQEQLHLYLFVGTVVLLLCGGILMFFVFEKGYNQPRRRVFMAALLLPTLAALCITYFFTILLYTSTANTLLSSITLLKMLLLVTLFWYCCAYTVYGGEKQQRAQRSFIKIIYSPWYYLYFLLAFVLLLCNFEFFVKVLFLGITLSLYSCGRLCSEDALRRPHLFARSTLLYYTHTTLLFFVIAVISYHMYFSEIGLLLPKLCGFLRTYFTSVCIYVDTVDLCWNNCREGATNTAVCEAGSTFFVKEHKSVVPVSFVDTLALGAYAAVYDTCCNYNGVYGTYITNNFVGTFRAVVGLYMFFPHVITFLCFVCVYYTTISAHSAYVSHHQHICY